jgi:hypothetical protein
LGPDASTTQDGHSNAVAKTPLSDSRISSSAGFGVRPVSASGPVGPYVRLRTDKRSRRAYNQCRSPMMIAHLRGNDALYSVKK